MRPRPWPKDAEGHDVDPADMTEEERLTWEGLSKAYAERREGTR